MGAEGRSAHDDAEGNILVRGEGWRRARTAPDATFRRRPLTAAEVLQSGDPSRPLSRVAVAVEDDSMKRLLKTPRVFRTGKDIRHNRRNELRANLLPSILQIPDASGAVVAEGPEPVDPTVEATGKHYNMYRQQLAERDEMENKVQFFLNKDHAFPSDWDPAQVAAQNCVAMKDLLESRAARFRRPKESLLNTSSALPFSHSDQTVDLQELTDILTLDFSRIEMPWKATSGRPGFTSIQLASRVPLIVRDSSQPGAVVETEVVPGNDLHMLRLDLQPGEVRQIAYNLGSRHFRGTALANRMAAVVDPESSALAGVVRSLRGKEAEAAGLAAVLTDVLRDVSKPLPQRDDALKPEEGAAAERLEAMVAESRSSLRRLLEVADNLAALAQPLAPSLAHAIDRLGLICVREVDRLAGRCHQDYEQLLKAYNNSEKARLEAEDTIEKIGGSNSGGAELQSRIKILEVELRKQERMHSELLKEKVQLEAAVKDDLHVTAQLKRKLKDLEEECAKLRKRSRSSSPPPEEVEEAGWQPTEEDVDIQASVPSSPLSPSSPQAASKVGSKRQGAKAGKAPTTFSVGSGVQTDTEVYFSEDVHDLEEEVALDRYNEIMQTSYRLYSMLCHYEWNPKASAFLRRPEDEVFDPDGEVMPPKDRKQNRRQSAAAVKLSEAQSMQTKVGAALYKARMSEMEETVIRLEALAQESFDSWLSQLVKDAGGKDKVDTQQPFDPKQLLQTGLELVRGEGMRRRIRELEDQVSHLLPMLEEGRELNEATAGNSGNDLTFWKRIMRSVHHSMATRRGSTFMKAQAAQASKTPVTGVTKQLQMLPNLLCELASIWSCLPPKPDIVMPGVFMTRPQPHEVMQLTVKNFYLKSFGRHKQVEQAVFNLCRAVLDHSSNLKVLLFALLCDILQPTSLALGERIPHVRNDTETELGRRLNPSKLSSLPADAAHAVFEVMRTLRSLRRSRTYAGGSDGSLERLNSGKPLPTSSDGDDEQAEFTLPLQLVLAAGHATIGSRSKVTAHFFTMLLYGYAEFPDLPPIQEELSERPQPPKSVTPRSDNEDRSPRPSPDNSPEPGEVDVKLHGDALFISHLLAADAWQQRQGKAEESDLVDRLWSAAMGEAPGSRIQAGFREEDSESLDNVLAAEAMLELANLQVTVSFAARALKGVQASTGPLSTEELHGQAVEHKVTKQSVAKVMNLWKESGGAGSLCITESRVLWAALWALALERAHEIELIGDLFESIDESADGFLQFDEFLTFMSQIAPQMPEADVANLFMAVAEDTAADMTKQAFIHLALRMGIGTDIDQLVAMLGKNTFERKHS
eukprot:TRINITY_DN24165_c0_g1_i1.p1 TRINITY_DN24165_c0_g1~~TRINITY_DN24165_c0_g1_i1.p1  ORF type:complete len:1319 (+),score=355.91 TRINITY_DN24165_c0_g1_i1:46-4002(+)